MAVDTDTKKYLDEVKKGKQRRFVMICKGVKILSLIVYKKGPLESYKKQAKKEGKGQFYHGVVEGKGVNISFKLARSDGFDDPPGKEVVLKDFLATEAEMKFKPSYEIVDEPPTDFDESETSGAVAAQPPESEEWAPEEPESADVQPVEEPEFEQTATSPLNPGAPQPATPPPQEATSGLAEFTSRLKEVLPIAVPLAKAGGDRGQALLPLLKAIQAQRTTGDVVRGLTTLDRIDAILKEDQFESRYLALEETVPSDLDRLRKVNGSVAEKIQKVVEGAAGHAGKGNFKVAFTYLEKAAATIGKYLKGSGVVGSTPGSETDGPRPSADATGTGAAHPDSELTSRISLALQSWRAAFAEASRGLENLSAAILKEDEPYARDASAVVLRLIRELPSEIDNTLTQLQAAIAHSDEATRSKLATQAMQNVVDDLHYVERESEAIDLCQTNPYDISVSFRPAIPQALSHIRQAIELV